MAGEWIKIRPSLLTDPKVNGIARILESSPAVTGVLSNRCDGDMSEYVTRNVMRNVTLATLVTVWGAANEHTRDGVFHNSDLYDIDDIAGIPGFGEAMQRVGWAEYDAENDCVTLPNFNEYNTSGKERSRSKAAERQRRYREKQKQGNAKSDVTNNVTRDVTNNDREEKRREDIETPNGVSSAQSEKSLSTDGDESDKSQTEADPPEPEDPPVERLPLNDNSEYPVTQTQIDEWQRLFPAVDVDQQIRGMRAWLQANTTRRKTRKGINRFITNWLSREQDNGGNTKRGDTGGQSRLSATERYWRQREHELAAESRH